MVKARCPEVTPPVSGVLYSLKMTGRNKGDAYCATLGSDPLRETKANESIIVSEALASLGFG